jgi:hypothetical protein
MKIRQGFVSNSSSSSFCIRVSEKFPNVFSLAKHMIRCRNWDKRDKYLLRKINEQKGRDPDSKICFPTCNYDTYIVRHGDMFLVDTCNNHDYGLDEKFYPREEIEGFPWDEDFNFAHNGTEFWFVNYGITAQTIVFDMEDSYCPTCMTDYVQYKSKIICPECKKEKG